MADEFHLEVRGPSVTKNLVQVLAVSTVANAPDVFPGLRVVAVNRLGREHILQQYQSRRSARKALPGFQAELDQLGVAAWRKLHDLPPHFEIMQPPEVAQKLWTRF